jgi:hypothetical protein
MIFAVEQIIIAKGVLKMGRGEHFNHTNKNHPGNFPKNTVRKKIALEELGDEEFLVTQEAFKNRLAEDETNDTARLLPKKR